MVRSDSNALAGYARNMCARRPFSTIIPTNRDNVSLLEARSQEVVPSSVTGARPGMDMTRGSDLYGFSEVRLLEISLGSDQDTLPGRSNTDACFCIIPCLNLDTHSNCNPYTQSIFRHRSSCSEAKV